MNKTIIYINSLRKVLLFLCIICGAHTIKAQITITPGQTAAQLVQKLVGAGITVINPTLTCPNQANGIFVATNSNLGIDSGVILTSGMASSGFGIGANGLAGLTAVTSNNAAGDAMLTQLGGQSTNDACILEFDFLPQGDTVKFDFVFSSEEYFGYSCDIFNDVFGFFIAGPGITGFKNLAVIPNTNIPISVNSTTNPLITNPASTIRCTQIAPGSPFSQYFIDNSSGTTVVHSGFTKVFTAKSAVTPCQQYTLKLAIADGTDFTLDSGVWLKAGSLTSNNISIKPLGGGGLTKPEPYCVRGCLPGQFVFTRPVGYPTPLTIKYQITGTAINGLDYTFIPDSIIIPPGATSATRSINPLNIFPPAGAKTVKLRIFNPYFCTAPVVIDSAILTIYDSIYVNVLTPDTAICIGETINLDGEGDPLLTYSWSPAGIIADPTSLHTTSTPSVSTLYELRASLPGSGCPPAHSYADVKVRVTPQVDAGPTRTTCLGTPVQLNVNCVPVNQPYTYSWTPANGLSSTTIGNPLANPAADETYYLVVNPGAIGCDGYDTVLVRVLPNDFEFNHQDTAICKGQKITTNVVGSNEFSYFWTPTDGVNNPFIMTPEIKPDTSATYVVTAKYPGCPDMVHKFEVDVQPVPEVNAGLDREMCQWDTLRLHGSVGPEWYTKYDISWSPASSLSTYPKVRDVVFVGDNTVDMKLLVTTPAGCVDSDIVQVIVHPGNFGTMQPEGDQTLCPNDTLYAKIGGGVAYKWSPTFEISNSESPDVKIFPAKSTTYRALIIDEHGCRDTFDTYVRIVPEAVISLEDVVKLHPGETVQLRPEGNCISYQWFPHVGLSATDIANPVASPEVNTRYILQGITEFGCIITDSIDVVVAETELNLPNAFAPGSSKELKIIRRGIATLKYFRIFNRWGVKVFETTDINKGWDGYYNGELQPMGVYVYTVEAVTDKGAPFAKQGNITLIR